MNVLFLHMSLIYVSMLSALTQLEVLTVSAIWASYPMEEITV